MAAAIDFAPIRAPYASSTAPSVAESLPSVDFGFDDLRACMSSFTQRFDEFIDRGRKRVLEERNQFLMSVDKVKADQAARTQAIALLRQKATQHASTLTSQSAEAADMHNAIDSLTRTRDSAASTLATTKACLTTARQAVSVHRAAQRKHAAHIAQQKGMDVPELDFWENVLGMRMEGTGKKNRLKFVFVGCDERRDEREAWFELDMGGGGEGGAISGVKKLTYEVVGSEPKVDGEKVERCLLKMNEGEDLAGFLKGMRKVFVDEMRMA